MQTCPSCKTALPDNARYCGHCGCVLDAATTMKIRRSSSVEVEPVTIDFSSATVPGTGHKVPGILLKSVRHVISSLLTKVQDDKPEMPPAGPRKAEASRALVWGWLPILSLTGALGVLSVAYAYTNARKGATGGEFFFWFGLLLLFIPTTMRLISSKASRFERISLLCVVYIYFYLVNVLYSPLAFTNHDAFQHWRTAEDIATSGHLFTENALLPVSPFYPGLEIVTNALSTLSGLSIFQAAILVIGVAHLLMILSLFMLCERLTNSARIAGIASILYITNSHFLIYDSQFIYESLALPLATFTLFAMVEHEKLSGNYHLIAWVSLGAVVITHHLTDYIFDGLFLLWLLIYGFLHPTSLYKSNIFRTALFGIVAPLAWITLKGNPIVSYLSSYVTVGLNELGGILARANGTRHFFTDYAGQQTPLWERLMTIASFCIVLLGLPFGLLCIWQRYRSNTLLWMFCIASLFFPIIQVFRLTNSGYEIADRPIPFLFIPICCILAICIAQFWPTRWLNGKQTLLITCILTVIFLGGVVLGLGPPWEILPGPYLVGAHERSIEPEGIQAALWAYSSLGPNNRTATDLNNQLLMGTYGDQRIVTPEADNVDVTDVFFSSSLGPYDMSLLRRAQVRYLVIDQRLSTALPRIGFYFEATEPGAFQRTTPISLETLMKFNSLSQVNRVFDSGNIVIYDIGGLINAPEKP